MSMLNLWNNFSKRRNSTKAPSGAADLSIDVKLKEETSLSSPVFIASGDLYTVNYAQFAGMYYFVDDVTSLHNGLCEISCSKDVLATYKSQIQASSQYVLYYTHNNTEVTDRRLSTKTSKTVQKNTGSFDTLGNGSGTNYAVALNVVGEHNVDTYITDQNTARTILSDLDNWFDNTGDYDPDTGSKEGSGFIDFASYVFNDVKEAVAAYLEETLHFWKQWFATGKAADNLKSAYMLPLPVSAIGGYTHNIELGKYNTGISATRVNDRIFSDGATVNIPWQANDWRRNSPYHELFLYIPYIGLITLSASDLIGDTTLNISVSIDITSGDAVFTVYTDSNRYIGQYTTNMAATFAVGTSDVPVAQMFNSIAGAAASIGASVASGGAGGVINSIGDTLSITNVIAGMPTCIGSNAGGAVLGLTDQVICYSIFHDTNVTPSSISAVKGTPYNGVLSLSGVSGYVQTSGASVNMPGFSGDRDAVNSLLDGGIYIE